MKLQIGCSEINGIYREKEWINIDIRKHKYMEIQGSGLELPLKTNTFDEVRCIHVLEHLTRDKYPRMIQEMHRVLKPGGVVYVEVPDFKGTIDQLVHAFNVQDPGLIHVWTTSLYGKSERDGMSHHWGFYEGLLRREIRRYGFNDVVRLTIKDEMISTHFKKEPILLIRGVK